MYAMPMFSALLLRYTPALRHILSLSLMKIFCFLFLGEGGIFDNIQGFMLAKLAVYHLSQFIRPQFSP